MKTYISHKVYWLIALFLILAVGIVIKGCDTDRTPVRSQQQGLTLKLADSPEIRAKATGVTIVAEGLKHDRNPNGKDRIEQTITELPANLEF